MTRLLLFLLAIAAGTAALLAIRPVPNVAIVYSVGSAEIRRVVYAEDGASPAAAVLSPGEAALFVRAGLDDDLTKLVAAAAGQTPRAPLAAVIDADGRIEALLAADPTIDRVPGRRLVAAGRNVTIGDRFQGGRFFSTRGEERADIHPPAPPMTLRGLLEATTP